MEVAVIRSSGGNHSEDITDKCFKLYYFLEMGHFHKLLCEEMIFPLLSPIPIKMEDFFDAEISIYSRSLWKCHFHNKGFLMQKKTFIPERDFSFILCKYLHFI